MEVTKTEHLSDAELVLFQTHPHVRESLGQFDAELVSAVMGLLASVPETGGQAAPGQSAYLLNEIEREAGNGE